MSKFDPSTIITDFTKENIILGIDEAGRGPVLGPMVYACAYWAKEHDDHYKQFFKFDDSKKLTAKQREGIFHKMKEYPNCIQFDYISLSAETISSKMLQRSKTSLNKMAFDAACSLVRRALAKGVNLTEVCVDTIGKPEIYKEFLEKNIFKRDIVYHVEEKADAKYPCVSAASEVAKVTRDEQLENWRFVEEDVVGFKYIDRNMGSGYPGDPKTKAWLDSTFDPVFGFPTNVRFSWKTIPTYLKKKECDIHWEGETCFLNTYQNYKNKDKQSLTTTTTNTNQSLFNFASPKEFYSKNSLSLDFTI